MCIKNCGACCFLAASDPPDDPEIAAQVEEMTAASMLVADLGGGNRFVDDTQHTYATRLLVSRRVRVRLAVRTGVGPGQPPAKAGSEHAMLARYNAIISLPASGSQT